MWGAFFKTHNFRSLAVWAGNDRLRMVNSLIHDAILNENYFNIVSKQGSYLIRRTGAPECLIHEILIRNFCDELIHIVTVYSRCC